MDYTDAGIGMPIIFIPGLTEFKEAFVFQSHGLKDKYRVIGYDVRRGLKRATDYTLERLVSDLHGFMQALGLESAVICGHSFGGLIAIQFALQYPEKTKALILVSSFATAPDVSSERFSSWMSSARHPLHKSLGAAVKLHLARLLGGRSARAINIQHQAAAVKDVAHQATNLSSITVAQRMRIVEKVDFRSALPEMVTPTLIIAGSKDRREFLASAQQLYKGIPDTTLEVIEGTGHFCFLTKHDEFNMTVDDFLSSRMASIS